MITILCGNPGAGKTALLVEWLRTIYKDRPVYAYNVKGLTLPHTELADLHDWPNVVPDGALVVADEVQEAWRPRGPGQKVPADIAALETHRHRGLDFIVLSQKPRLIDANVRSLCGRLVYLRDQGILGRHWYEWNECPDQLNFKAAPIRKRYRLPKAAFSLYKSATLHIKPERSFPTMLAVLAVAVVGFGYFGWRSYSTIGERAGWIKPGAAAPAAGASAPVRSYGSRPRTLVEYQREAIPVVPGRPETAPMYDHLRQVVRMQRVIGGFCINGRCRCFDQDGGDPKIDALSCALHVTDPPFDPYRDPSVRQSAGAASAPRT